MRRWFIAFAISVSPLIYIIGGDMIWQVVDAVVSFLKELLTVPI